MIYCIWNNKGGVGKTFLTFTLANEHAFRNPDKKILLVDMCPQANLSEIMLGGDGDGDKKLDNLLVKRTTVGGYFDERITSPHITTGSETNYLLHGNDYNSSLTDNVYFLCGDPSLELQSQAINQIGSQTLPADTWKNIHKWLKNLIDACVRKLGNSESVDVFIDCNPSFSSYTELALVASDNIIIPCSCDDSSARALHNVRNLVYENSKVYDGINFFSKCNRNGLQLPLIRAIVLNRTTLYNTKANSAFQAMFDKIKRVALQFKTDLPNFFVSGGTDFAEILDHHSIAIVFGS